MSIDTSGLVGVMDRHPRKIEGAGFKKLEARVLAADLVPLRKYLSMPGGCGLLGDGFLTLEESEEQGFSLSFRCTVSLLQDSYPGLIKILPGSRDANIVRGVILSISLNNTPAVADGILFTLPDLEEQKTMKGRGIMDQSTEIEYQELARSISGANEIMSLNLSNASDGWQAVLNLFEQILNQEG